MANKFTYQVLRDTQTDSVIKITGAFDGSGQEANGSRIQANTLTFSIAFFTKSKQHRSFIL